MSHHGYVKQLKETALKLGASVEYFELLKKCGNKLNPSGVIVLTKSIKKINHIQKLICPITKTELVNHGSFCFSSDSGLIYPIIKDIPILCSENAILGSKMTDLI